MDIKKEDLEKSQIKLTIELQWDEFLPFVAKAGVKISESKEFPGFRKGQAPLDVVKQKVGDMVVFQEAAELAVQKVLPEVIKKESLHTVGQPQLDIEKLAEENPFIFTAILPLLPKITIGEISKISVEKDKIEVSKEEIEKVVENLRRMRASEVLVEREAKLGDKVEVKFNVYLDKVPIEGGSSNKYPLVLGENTMIPGFEDNVVGMKKDEEKEFELSFPVDYHNKQLAGKKAEFKVKLLATYEIKLPELDDEFIKNIGDFDSKDALYDVIKKNIHEEKEHKVNHKFERDCITNLVEASTFTDIPEVMINRELQTMLHELEHNVSQQGVNFDDYLTNIKKDRKQLTLDLSPDAVKRIKSALVIKELAYQEKVEVTDEDMVRETEIMKGVYQKDPDIMKKMEQPEYREYLKNVIRNKKTLDLLKEKISAKK